MDEDEITETLEGSSAEIPELSTGIYLDSRFNPPALRLSDEFVRTENGWRLTRRWVKGNWSTDLYDLR